MGQPYAIPQDVADLFRPLSDAEGSTVEALLAHASTMLRARFPHLDDRIAAGTLDAGQPMVAVVNMVLRVVRNPAGLRSETVGPMTRVFDSSQAAGLLAVTDAETALLSTSSSSSPVGTIRTRPALGFGGGSHVRGW